MLGVDPLQQSEVFVDLQAFLEKPIDLNALRHLKGTLVAVVIVALSESAFVGEAWEFVVGLDRFMGTLYSWNSKGTSLTRLRWFSGRSRR